MEGIAMAGNTGGDINATIKQLKESSVDTESGQAKRRPTRSLSRCQVVLIVTGVLVNPLFGAMSVYFAILRARSARHRRPKETSYFNMLANMAAVMAIVISASVLISLSVHFRISHTTKVPRAGSYSTLTPAKFSKEFADGPNPGTRPPRFEKNASRNLLPRNENGTNFSDIFFSH